MLKSISFSIPFMTKEITLGEITVFTSKAGNVQVGPGTFCHTRKQGNDQTLLGPCQKNSKTSLNKFLQAHTNEDINYGGLKPTYLL